MRETVDLLVEPDRAQSLIPSRDDHSESEADHIASILKDLPECRADEDAIRQPPDEPERRCVIHVILHHRARAIGLKCVFVPSEAVRALLLKIISKPSARLPRGDARAPTNG